MEKENNDVTNKDLYKLIQSVLDVNETIKKQNNELKEEISDLKKTLNQEIVDIKNTNIKLQDEVNTLQSHVLNLKRKIKKYNIIVYGLREEVDDEVTGIQKFIELINSKCEVDTKFHDIRDFYRIGKKNEDQDKPRPLLIEFIYQKQLSAIFENSSALKGSGVIISRDYTQEDYKNRKVLYNCLKKLRENKVIGKIRSNKLVINGTSYSKEDTEHPTFLERILKLNRIQSVYRNLSTGQKRKESVSDRTLEVPSKRVP
ncbi:unnamed protein product [Psylliodes chrysocephalus]|uniref:Uncharacterized protein n=1 Tax=Psylliodes chrysocephalus TaxID=3402493 RepID=A0A9P0D871_9CUCU|nr:unnamed protein product [Psylliodes chrysocephala]